MTTSFRAIKKWVSTSEKQLWAAVAFGLVLVFNAVFNSAFFAIEFSEGRIVGSMVDVLERGSIVAIVAMGMALVVGTGGIDLSVGAVMALSGSTAAWLLSSGISAPVAIGLALLIAVTAGIWNGALVTALGIQPIVATLVLMVAGRGAAQLLNDGQIVAVGGNPLFAYLGSGTVFGLPFSCLLCLAMVLLLFGLTRGTAAGLFIVSVGSNETAARIAGVQVRLVKLVAYATSGFCAGLAGLIYTSDIGVADANNAGLYVELDAILAVVLGGTSLYGGRFYLGGALLGALTMQAVTTTILMIQFRGHDIPPEFAMIVKAIVVLVVCLFQSNVFRSLHRRRAQPT